MSWRPEDLSQASTEELEGFAADDVPTLRQMHAIRELAARGAEGAAEAVVAHIGPEWRMGGMPVGYLGAMVLFEAGAEARSSLLTELALAPPADRDALLRWLSPAPREALAGPVRVEREILVHDPCPDEAVRQAASRIAGEAVEVDVLPLAGAPAAVAMVTLSAEGWSRLERDGARLASALSTTVYWPPPAELGPLGPDLRVAVDPDGGRRRVRVVPTVGGYEVL